MSFGAELWPDGRVRFRLWAPTHAGIQLALEERAEPLPLRRDEHGWHELLTADARAGSRYRFVLPDGSAIPDPASRFQPFDAQGPSEVVDPTAYEWRTAWRGRPWTEAILYELHVGCFTPEGTFAAAAAKLPHIESLGVTAIELMPLADFAGARGWGYDGVLPFAPESSYGRPEDLKAFVDAAHARGIMVLLDVVYNHFGPVGNPLPACAPAFFTDRHKTPWGAAVNFDGADSGPVRELVIHNALYWIEEFQLDGLRLDAVHAIIDDSPTHVLAELAERVRASAPERPVHLILENEENQASWLRTSRAAPAASFDAQWNDDVHHVLHTAATGEDRSYYADYAFDTEKLGRALAEGFAFQGELMHFRGSPRGEPSRALPPAAFVAFIQNHDQVGNRAFGERLGHIASPEALRAVSAVYLLAPQIPMIFMGEEWSAKEPFLYFCDFEEPLASAIREGRRKEFSSFPEFADPEHRKRIPDPLAAATFLASKLGWADLAAAPHADHLMRYKALLARRKKVIAPRLERIAHGGRFAVHGPGAVEIRWDAGEETLILGANLSSAAAALPPIAGREVWREGLVDAGGRHSPWSVRWALEPKDNRRGPAA